MNSYSPSFENGNNTGMRQAPTPNMSQHTNGVNAGAVGATSFQNPGHTQDMITLLEHVSRLQEQLAANRRETDLIMAGVHQMHEARAEATSPTTAAQVNGEVPSSNGTAHAAQILNLQHRLQNSESQVNQLLTSLNSMTTLLSDYENTFTQITNHLRNYSHQNQTATIALHAHYDGLLAAERQLNLNLRLEQQQWQAGLKNVAEWARKALDERIAFECEQGWRGQVASLKNENKVLRKLAGWEEVEDSDEEEEKQDVRGEEAMLKIEL
ncbi:hypothetical protein BJ546DRAFT_102130 [Cryomyces antarcticus]